ncbi:glycosyltransferase [Nostocoides australiense]|nr:glycosyltransferase [Tetrasphaera australiensis]HRW01977.1 glycosyltransferase [Tetrasphaera sp.]
MTSAGSPNPAPRRQPPGAERILLMSSNGAGMGHLTRLLAYAAHLPAEVEPYVLSLSQAVPVVAQFGYRYEYLPSHGALGMTSALWQPLFQERLIETVGRVRPRVVVFDGTHPYRGIDAAREVHPGVRWVWSRRGMWKPGLNGDQLAKSAWFDEVIEPGDMAAEADKGASATAPAYRVGPVTLTDREDLLPRAEARAALGLPAEGRIGLISLGAGNINDTSRDIGAAAAALRAAGCAVAVTDVAIAAAAHASDVHLVRAYPLARCYAAFDLVVAATGYNSFHEVLRLGVPAILIPNAGTSLDDQAARATYAAQRGWALAPEAGGLDDAVRTMLSYGADMAAAAQHADPGNGARAAAERLLAVAVGDVEGGRV